MTTFIEAMDAAASAFARDGNREHGIWEGAEPEGLPEHILGPLVRFALRQIAGSKLASRIGKAASQLRSEGLEEPHGMLEAHEARRQTASDQRKAYTAWDEAIEHLAELAAEEPAEEPLGR